MKNLGFREGISAGLPVLAGYFPIAVTFGLMAKPAGIPFAVSLAAIVIAVITSWLNSSIILTVAVSAASVYIMLTAGSGF